MVQLEDNKMLMVFTHKNLIKKLKNLISMRREKSTRVSTIVE